MPTSSASGCCSSSSSFSTISPHIDSGTTEPHRLTDLAHLDLQLQDVGAPLTPVEDGLQLLGGSQAGLHADLGAVVHQGAECLVHHDLVESQGCQRSGDAFNEVDLILASPPLQYLPVRGVSGLLHGEMPSRVCSDRISG